MMMEIKKEFIFMSMKNMKDSLKNSFLALCGTDGRAIKIFVLEEVISKSKPTIFI